MNQNNMKLPEVMLAVKAPAKICSLRKRKNETQHHYRMRHITKAVAKSQWNGWEDRLLAAFRKELL